MKTTIIFLAIALCFLSCENVTNNQPKVLFEMKTWGHFYGQSGTLIDSYGNIRTYHLNNFNEDKHWMFPDKLGLILEDDMKINIALCDTNNYKKINLDSISLYMNKILEASYVNLVTKDTIVGGYMEAGGGAMYAYLYDRNSKSYKQILIYDVAGIDADVIKMETTIRSNTNTNKAATDIYNWLIRVRNNY